MPQKLVLLDANGLVYRAFFALPYFTTSDGRPTNAVYGFTSMLINMLRDEEPTHVAVSFDVGRATFRTEAYAEYKAGRQKAPETGYARTFLRQARDLYVQGAFNALVAQWGPNAPFSAYVFKTVIDPFAGKLSIMRVMSGKIAPDMTCYVPSRQIKEKMGHMFRLEGKKQEAVKDAVAGEIIAAAKFKEIATGDTLCDEKAPILYEGIAHFAPNISFALEPKSKADEDKLPQGLHRIMEEDQTIAMHRDEETRDFILSGMGQQHIEIIVAQTRRAGSPYNSINPSGRVPYLIRDDGVGLEESAVICAYLDHLDGNPVFELPAEEQEAWEARRLEALARSMLDGLSVWNREIARPRDERSPTVVQHEADRARRLRRKLKHAKRQRDDGAGCRCPKRRPERNALYLDQSALPAYGADGTLKPQLYFAAGDRSGKKRQ